MATNVPWALIISSTELEQSRLIDVVENVWTGVVNEIVVNARSGTVAVHISESPESVQLAETGVASSPLQNDARRHDVAPRGNRQCCDLSARRTQLDLGVLGPIRVRNAGSGGTGDTTLTLGPNLTPGAGRAARGPTLVESGRWMRVSPFAHLEPVGRTSTPLVVMHASAEVGALLASRPAPKADPPPSATTAKLRTPNITDLRSFNCIGLSLGRIAASSAVRVTLTGVGLAISLPGC